MTFKTLFWKDNKVYLIDQRKLPLQENYEEYSDYRSLIQAIKEMVVRGAPAIGVAGAMSVALGALEVQASCLEEFKDALDLISNEVAAARPTAVNLPWAVSRMQKVYKTTTDGSLETLQKRLIEEALQIFNEDVELCLKIGQHGSALLEEGDVILTHCNAGALATAGQGTALSPIYEAIKQGKRIAVYADETRPFLQGARLTAWELQKNKVPVTLIPDVAAASLIRSGIIQKIIVGADRIVSNGDFANKIGTYPLALAAQAHKIPFYVAAPFSTIDWALTSGDQIPIEERPSYEVTNLFNQQVAPEGIAVRNPAFDTTPAHLVTGIITERGVITQPLKENLKKVYGEASILP